MEGGSRPSELFYPTWFEFIKQLNLWPQLKNSDGLDMIQNLNQTVQILDLVIGQTKVLLLTNGKKIIYNIYWTDIIKDFTRWKD